MAEEHAAGIDLQGAGSGGGNHARQDCALVTQLQRIVQGEPAALAELDGLPVDVQRALTEPALFEGQGVLACTAVQYDYRVAEVECADSGGVIVVAHFDFFADLAARPGENIVAVASTHFTFQCAAAHAHFVDAVASADISANGAVADNDGVVAQTGHQVANNHCCRTITLRHPENVVGKFHVHVTDLAAGELGIVAVSKLTCDAPASHPENIETLPLVQRLNRAAGHGEGVDLLGLHDRTQAIAG
ncbi:hypothetical protein D3C75_741390 [compost metagenome]